MITAVTTRVLVMLLVASGCDTVFDLDEVDLPAARPDAPALVGERPNFCQSGPLLDVFDTSNYCYWAAIFEPLHLSQHDSVLDVIARGDEVGEFFAGCTGYTLLPFTDNGLYVHVPRVMDGVSGYTKLSVRSTSGTLPSFGADILHIDGKLHFLVNGTVHAERDDAPAWWRLRRPGNGNTVSAEVSTDGAMWQTFGSATADLPRTFAIDIGAGISAAATAPSMATFDVIGVCD